MSEPRTGLFPTFLQPLWRHRKRGSYYSGIGIASVQAATPIPEGALVKVYLGEDGDLWVRAVTEFDDGRYEEIERTHPNYIEASEKPTISILIRQKVGGHMRTIARAISFEQWTQRATDGGDQIILSHIQSALDALTGKA